jgi:hypothetical protein
MATIMIVIGDIFFKKTAQMLFAEYDDMVEELCPR